MRSGIVPWLCSLLISSSLSDAAAESSESSESESAVQVHLTDSEQTAMASNRFALDMYRELAGK